MAQSLIFTVKRREPELITPSNSTPHEIKSLSNIDDQDSLRWQVPGIQFYNYDPIMEGKDLVDVIRKAIAKTLVRLFFLAFVLWLSRHSVFYSFLVLVLMFSAVPEFYFIFVKMKKKA
ncbi:transferase family protein [Medicago truncatula]|uniref:Transferase family protein n=1 Tax=Medicago truncatula TaxID=3880 RepID=A0A072UYX2_MEDTR|nr:transferase family protein [Medicago truncatula]